MRRAIVMLLLVVACKHTTTTEGTLAPERVDEDAGPCRGPCCERPQAGTACPNDGGFFEDKCSWTNHCPTGLVTAEVTQCTNGGVWEVVSGACPADGQLDERYCPASQPAPDSPCDPVPRVPCGYVIACEGGISATAQATCINGKWQTTPLRC